ncbi:hypothetical protein An07g03800 [Aspergillus niger]|uniref:Uncharacterized protein n=2 Tax=Aspergillus niger TaxID=5061 RepID=A2QMY9_ASPNC|nr:hypothetical protein An07g03800 [Aspergillus niger]CAK48130.1 hypothetical protein An07g03800 [Aspergillus niger]
MSPDCHIPQLLTTHCIVRLEIGGDAAVLRCEGVARNCSVPGIGCFEDKLRAVPLRPRPLHVLRVLVVRSDVFVLQGLRDVMERLFTSKLRSKDLSGTLHHPCYPILNAADAECQLIDGSLD